jgi:glycosyltransferase involved in cell wall biosynthesis
LKEKMKILLISKHFPPRTSALSLQAGKVALAIAQAGADVRVIAGEDISEYSVKDRSLVPDLPHIYQIAYGGSSSSRIPFFRSSYRVWQEINETNFFSTWIRSATTVAMEVLEKFKPDAVMSISNPFDSHLVALNICRKFNLPWLASFSDPYPPSYAPSPYDLACRTRFMVSWQIRMLKKVVASASALHFHSKYTAISLAKATGTIIEGKSHVLPHIGYQGHLQDFSLSTVGEGWLVHVGYLSRERCVPELLLGAKICLEKHPDLFKGIMCVGGVAPEFMAIAKKMNLHNKIKLIGKVSYEKSIEIGSGASALLLLEAKMPYSAFLPSKIADYSAMKRPILAITPTVSAVRDYFSSYKIGIAVNHNPNEISLAIFELFGFKVDSYSSPHDHQMFFDEFCSEHIGKDFMSILSSIL